MTNADTLLSHYGQTSTPHRATAHIRCYDKVIFAVTLFALTIHSVKKILDHNDTFMSLGSNMYTTSCRHS